MPPMDRISCLPDEVICHILSFLGTKRCVQSSVLSKRWRFLWAHVPSLQLVVFDNTFPKIVSKIFLQHKHDIHTFYLDLYLDCGEKEFESWIVSITKRNVHNLWIHLRYQLVLPQCIFACKTLIDLSLNGCGDIPNCGMYFPVLKKLKLYHLRCESHDSLAHLISACPVLELLNIKGKLDGHCCVSSPTLIRLQLVLDNEENLNFEVKLDTPALRYLHLELYIPSKFSAGALDSLIEADISLYRGVLNQDNFIDLLLAFVGKLCNVRLLTLSTDQTAVIHESAFSALAIKFHNLTELSLRAKICFITNFLENANNLRVLKLKDFMVDIFNQSCWMEPKRVPACLISHLQSVKFRYLGCSEDKFEMVKYIWMNGKVLKRMKIIPPAHERDWKIKSLALFERGSQECQLLFRAHDQGWINVPL